MSNVQIAVIAISGLRAVNDDITIVISLYTSRICWSYQRFCKDDFYLPIENESLNNYSSLMSLH